MNLALITQDFPPEIGGIETYASELARRFVDKCDHFFVIAPYKENAAEADENLPYKVHRIKSSNALLGIKAIRQVPALFKKYKTTHVFHAQWQTLPVSVVAKRKGLVKKVFVAAHARELLFSPFEYIPGGTWAYNRYMRKMLDQADGFFPVSAYTKRLLRLNKVSQKKIKVVINGTDPTRFYPMNIGEARKEIGIADDRKVILTITRLVSRKGIDTVLKAMKRVLKVFPNALYIVVGDGKHKERLNRLSKDLEVDHAVQFMGRVPYHQLIYYYNSCNVFVMPSKTEPPDVEGFGIVFLEANACEKPVIGSYSGGIPSAILEGETGLLVQEGASKEVAESIIELLSNKSLAKQMGENGRKRIVAKANWDQAAAKILQYIESNS